MALSTQAIDHRTPSQQRLIIFGIILALAAPLITAFLDGYFKVWFDYTGKVFAGVISFWVIAAAIMVIIRCTEVDSWSAVWRSLGFRRVTFRTSLIVLILSFVLLFVLNLFFVLLSTYVFKMDISFTRERLRVLPIPLVVLLYLTGIFVEEILYRGYALQRLYNLIGNWTAAGLICGALFVFFHVPAYPPAHILGVIIPATLIITYLYIRLRNTSYTVMMHGVMNIVIVIAYVILPLLPQTP
jgi:uncharacterized protein